MGRGTQAQGNSLPPTKYHSGGRYRPPGCRFPLFRLPGGGGGNGHLLVLRRAWDLCFGQDLADMPRLPVMPQCHRGPQTAAGCWLWCSAEWQKQGSICAMSTASPGWLSRAPSRLFRQAARSQNCSGANQAIFCLSPTRNNLFLTHLGCSCVCRLLLWCCGQGQRTAESLPARQRSPAWGEGPRPDLVTGYRVAQRAERWKGTSMSPRNGAGSHLLPWLPPCIPQQFPPHRCVAAVHGSCASAYTL